MGTEAPTTIVIPIHCAPKKAPCPTCGKRGRRKRTLNRIVRTVAYKAVAFLEITYGEYAAGCDCCTTFRNTPEGVLPKAPYDNKVRDLVLDRILDDGMSIERTLESIRREFLLDLSTGFVYDVLRDRAAELDMAAHRRKVLEHFSGTLCVDELHLGRFTLLLATDPLSDLPVAFALVDKNDQDHMRRFLRNLRTWGLNPTVVVTDGSNLYPGVLAELWPDADHQLCVFHVIKDINKLILDAVRRLRNAMKRRGKAGRKKKRGRKGAKAKAAAAHRGLTVKEKAHFVFKHRHLIVKRRENLTEAGARRLDADAGVPARVGDAAAVRRPDLLAVRHAQGLPPGGLPPGGDRARPGVPGRAGVGQGDGATDEEKFPKLMAYLKNPVSRRVRTNNHVERTNRMFRFLEKVRYKWRRRRTLVRFVVLTLDGSGGMDPGGAEEDRSAEHRRARQDARPGQAPITSGRMRSRWRSARSLIFTMRSSTWE